MMRKFDLSINVFGEPDPLLPHSIRGEIASLAAKWIVEDGMEYATAKQKAAKQLLGKDQLKGNYLPNNTEIETEVRSYIALFLGTNHVILNNTLREIALLVMTELAAFQPYITGAVLQGTATQYSDVYIQCFCDTTKELAIKLLDAGVQYEVSETAHFLPAKQHIGIETLSFFWNGHWPESRKSRQLAQKIHQLSQKQIGVHLVLYPADDERGAARAATPSVRLSLVGLKTLINNATSADALTTETSAISSTL